MSAVLPFYNEEQSTHHVLSLSLSLQWVSTAIKESICYFKKLIESHRFSRDEIPCCAFNLNIDDCKRQD